MLSMLTCCGLATRRQLGGVVKVGRLLRRQWERVWDFYVIGKYGPAQGKA